jgi:hypothetical protein
MTVADAANEFLSMRDMIMCTHRAACTYVMRDEYIAALTENDVKIRTTRQHTVQELEESQRLSSDNAKRRYRLYPKHHAR